MACFRQSTATMSQEHESPPQDSKVKQGSSEVIILTLMSQPREARVRDWQTDRGTLRRLFCVLKWHHSIPRSMGCCGRAGWRHPWETSPTGRKRRYYRLTKNGRRQIRPLRRSRRNAQYLNGVFAALLWTFLWDVVTPAVALVIGSLISVRAFPPPSSDPKGNHCMKSKRITNETRPASVRFARRRGRTNRSITEI